VFCGEIKWIDALLLICDRTFDSRRYGRYRWYRCYDDVYCLWHMPISTTLQTEVSVSQSDWHKVGSVGGGPANRRSRNWRSKIHGKTKHRWSTINSEHQVNRRSVNRRSNLIWLAMEKPDLRLFANRNCYRISRISWALVPNTAAAFPICTLTSFSQLPLGDRQLPRQQK